MNWRRWSLVVGLLLLGGAGGYYWWWNQQLEQSQDKVIDMAARRYAMEPALIKAVVWRESHFNPLARGRAEEVGLMQLQEEAAREWAEAEHLEDYEHETCLDPGTNVLAGTWYLRKLLKRYHQTDNPLPYALADYNAGRANVLKWNRGVAATNSAVFIEQIRFPSTKTYVKAVMERYQRYRGTLAESQE